MKRAQLFFFMLPTLLCIMSCDNTTSVVTGDAKPFYSDQQYYPTEEGTFWRYRIDTTGATGGTVRDVGRRTSRIFGKTLLDSVEYTIQMDETIKGITTTYDTLYVRKSDQGVFFTSPQLRAMGGLSALLGAFPKEIQIIPPSLESSSSWSILNFEYTQIPFFPIYFRVTAAYLNKESIQLDYGTFKDCIKIRVTVDARFPNPQDPTNILNPLVINESASFWLSRPLGLVAGDGAEVVFALMQGKLPLSIAQRRMHQELIGYDIVQPSGTCPGGPR